MLQVKLLNINDCIDAMTDLFLDGVSNKVVTKVTVDCENEEEYEKMDLDKTYPKEIHFKQIDGDPVTSFKFGLIMSKYNHEVV